MPQEIQIVLIWIIYCLLLSEIIYIKSKFSKFLIKKVSSYQILLSLLLPPNLLRLYIIYKKRRSKKKIIKIIKNIIE